MKYTNNICIFVPYHNDYDTIHPLNFVLETAKQEYTKLKLESVYKVYYVCSGSGFIHTYGKKTELLSGDVFFTIPGVPFCIESGCDFTYMYISFIGTRGNILLDKLKISKNNFLFGGCNELYDFWKNGLDINSSLSDLMSESILLYTFSFLGNKILEQDASKDKNSDAFSVLKKYIDDHFSDTGLSLSSISKELNYNQKYISSLFKKKLKIGFVEYLNTVRIQYACTLIQQGYTYITDIAHLCGYCDPQYFSKVFKKKMYCSPREYIKQC